MAIVRPTNDRGDFNELRVVMGDADSYRLSHSTDASREAARRIAAVIGPRVPVIDLYLEALSYAPANHLVQLAERGTRIMFGPTIDAVLRSGWAARRRGRELSSSEARRMRIDYGPESRTAAAYDPSTDALIFPTAYRAADLADVVLHELGHALTIPRAQVRPALIEDLPSRLYRHVRSDCYTGVTPEDTLRRRALEALAEGYVYMIDGRMGQLPAALLSELTFILQTVEDGLRIRLEFETTPDGERTSRRVTQREIIDGTDPDEGHLFASTRLDPDAVPWDLCDDELAAARRRRRPAA